MKILWQDNDIVVAVKDYGVSSQESDGVNMVSLLRERCGCDIFPVHRLDVTTSGVMIYAKNQKSAGEYSTFFAQNRIKKTYLAVCYRGTLESSGAMKDYLFHDKMLNKTFVKSAPSKSAKEARLSYQIVEDYGEKCLVQIHLETGRSHQIRAQFANAGSVLVGDGKYGAKDHEQIRLHCLSLTLPNGKTFEERPEWKSTFQTENIS